VFASWQQMATNVMD